MKKIQFSSLFITLIFLSTVTFAQIVPVPVPGPGEGPALGDRITQNMIENELSLNEIRMEGMRIFSTPFNLFDGLGDGLIGVTLTERISPGGRPGLQNDVSPFLRMNGLDSQTCLECHSILSNATIPAKFAVGGVGAFSDSAFPGVIGPDIDDSDNNGFTYTHGRVINPPFCFGSGGVEQLGKEMTAELQAQKAAAMSNPNTDINLTSKGVSFGTISFDGVDFDTSNVEGIDNDLVVRPFGRKGCCSTIREFDIGAMQFHMGIQPVEANGIGEGNDVDDDGIDDELLSGELSALHIYQVSLDKPRQLRKSDKAKQGEQIFDVIGCDDCHIPVLHTESKFLPLSFPEEPTDPSVNVYIEINLHKSGFKEEGAGVKVQLFADLKRHNMGPDLAESTGSPLDSLFTTARLWGVADTGPWLHDGRAVTLTDAILMHGGIGSEANASVGDFDSLPNSDKEAVLAFLRTLRTPQYPNHDLHNEGHGDDDSGSGPKKKKK